MQGQQQQQHQPQVVVIQQPIVINGRPRKVPPYMLRGFMFPRGLNLPARVFILLLVLGLFGLFIGFTIAFIAFITSSAGYLLNVSSFFILVGGMVIGPGCYFCCKARQQYDELPQDHPDRHKFGSGFILPDIPCNIAVPANNTHTTYNVTPGVQGPVGGSASFQGYPSASAPYLQGSGVNTYYPQGPPGSKASSQMPPSTNPYYHGHPEGYPGQTGPSQSYQPPSSSAPYSGQSTDTYPTAAKDDLPPSYSDIEVNKCQ